MQGAGGGGVRRARRPRTHLHHDVRRAVHHKVVLLEVDGGLDDPKELNHLLYAVEIAAELILHGGDEAQPTPARGFLPLLESQRPRPDRAGDHRAAHGEAGVADARHEAPSERCVGSAERDNAAAPRAGTAYPSVRIGRWPETYSSVGLSQQTML